MEATDGVGGTRRVADYLAMHPGRWWRPQDLAPLVGLNTHQTAQALLYLANRGEVLRRRPTKVRSEYAGLAQQVSA